jgi:hypothetical protein
VIGFAYPFAGSFVSQQQLPGSRFGTAVETASQSGSYPRYPSAVRRSGSLPAEAGTRAAAPFPCTPFSAGGAVPPLRFGQVFLDEAEHFLHNQSASVAALRELFAFPSESVFAFGGILMRAATSVYENDLPLKPEDLPLQPMPTRRAIRKQQIPSVWPTVRPKALRLRP